MYDGAQSNAAVEFRHAFTGQGWDADLGMYNYGARWYDAVTALFASEDPSSFSAGDANLYRYVGNSPTNYIDPTGRTGVANGVMYGLPEGERVGTVAEIRRMEAIAAQYAGISEQGGGSGPAGWSWADAWYMATNPVATQLGFVIGVGESFADGSSADSLTGAVDGMLDTMIPVPGGSIPDIGPIYGNYDDYGNGQYVGVGWGVANGLVIGYYGAAGGPALARYYTYAETGLGAAEAGYNAWNGEASWGDALAVAPLLGDLAGRAGRYLGQNGEGLVDYASNQLDVLDGPFWTGAEPVCFIEGTTVLVVEAPQANEAAPADVLLASILGVVGLVITRHPEQRSRRGRTGSARRGARTIRARKSPLSNNPAGPSHQEPDMDSLNQIFSEADWRGDPQGGGEFSPVEVDEEAAPLPESRPRWRALGGAVAALCLTLAALFGLRGLGALSTSEAPVIAARPIEEVTVGERVLVDTPAAEEDLTFGREVDPASWRHVQFLMPKSSGGQIRIDLLRPTAWIKATGAEVGRTIHLSLPEIGPDGPAKVLAVNACPAIRPGAGEVVTGTFEHDSDKVLNMSIEGVDGPLGVTPMHLMYSVDRQGFVPAGELRQGERLSLREGPARITGIERRPGTHRVYNLEVHVAHVYHVTDAGVLVHNTCPDGPIALGVNELLDDFSTSVGGRPWTDWGRDDFLSNFFDVMNDSQNRVAFNLDLPNGQTIDTWGAVLEGGTRGLQGRATSWELYQIYSNPDWWERVTWYANRNPVDNPFQ